MLQQACCLLLLCIVPEVPAYDPKVTVPSRDRGQSRRWAGASPVQPIRAETLVWGAAAGREEHSCAVVPQIPGLMLPKHAWT